jgi:hypothetical protein
MGDAVVVLDEQDHWSAVLHPGVSIHNVAISFTGRFVVTW